MILARAAVLLTSALLLTPSVVAAQPAARPALQAMRTATPPAVDGVLDDEAWRAGAQKTGDWLSYNPLHGSSILQKTQVWVAHDAKYLYFAFQCDDPEPSRIRTSVTRRDSIWSDDWVGLRSSWKGPASARSPAPTTTAA